MNLPTPRPQPRSAARASVRHVVAAKTACAAPGLTALPAAPGAPLRLHPGYVDFLRQRLHDQRPRFAAPPLEQFARQVFADDLMVESYFHARYGRAGTPSSSGQASQILVPFEEACRAARRAERMGVLASFERPLACLAALIYPCGLFYVAHPAVQRESSLTRLDGAALRSMRHRVLEAPLRQLRGQHQGLADTLSAVLGFGDEGDCNPEQVSRIATAVVLANLRVSELWSG